MEVKKARRAGSNFLSLLSRFGRLVRSRLGQSSLSSQQAEALWFIAENNGAAMGDIGSYFHISPPSATFLVNEMVSAKLLVRKADPSDRRLVRLALTAAGKRVLKTAFEERTRVLRELLAPLSERDRTELERILEAIVSTDTK